MSNNNKKLRDKYCSPKYCKECPYYIHNQICIFHSMPEDECLLISSENYHGPKKPNKNKRHNT